MTSRTPLALARIGVGAAELALPDRLGTALLGRRPDTTERVVMRVLGVRHLAQAVGGLRGHALLGGPLLDALHALSMYGAGAVSERHRRGALLSAAGATGFALAAWRA
jgi:hypothetical protein